jgi:hypothetical protein
MLQKGGEIVAQEKDYEPTPWDIELFKGAPVLRLRLLMRIHTLPINFITNARCDKIHKEGVIITTKDKREQFIRADTVVLAVGTRQDNSLYPLLRAQGFETHLAGDCWHIGRIPGAIGDGLRLGCIL